MQNEGCAEDGVCAGERGLHRALNLCEMKDVWRIGNVQENRGAEGTLFRKHEMNYKLLLV